jgi:hypothetical protein
VISKIPTTNEGFKSLGLALGLYQKELGFFRYVASEIKVRIPECYVNRAENGTDFVLILEDLAPMRAGNLLESCTYFEAELALATVATLHARWWEDPRLEEFSEWLPTPGDAYFEILKGSYFGSVEKFHSHFGYLVTPEITEPVNRGAADYDRLVAVAIGARPHTFIHGDFRLDNMMFGDSPEADPFALLDWQFPFKANPLWDVIYFLGGNFDAEWRRANEQALLTSRHSALVDAGVTRHSTTISDLSASEFLT